VLTNCTFSGNSAVNGGGMYNSEGSPTLTACTFSGNLADIGGGMFNYYSSSPRMSKCKFNNNSAKYGGGLFNYHSDLMLLSCVFRGNYSYEYGGGIHNTFSDLTVVNCTLTGNSAGIEGSGIYMYVLPPQPPRVADGSNAAVPLYLYNMCVITNCILWENLPEQIVNYGLDMTVTYSDVQGGWEGEGNINADPCFVEPGYRDVNDAWIEGDYHLLQDSWCIDAGDPNYVSEPNETDLDGKPRVMGGRIDMGAYEYSPPIPAEARIIPRTINLASKGNCITCYIWLPEQYNVADIEPNSVFLEGEIQGEPLYIDEQQQVAITKFSREEVQGIISTGEVELAITGQLKDGTIFEATDIIRVTGKIRSKN